jgi:hypothetical protein
MTDESKRAISIGLFSIGIFAGALGCVGVPMAIFTIGVNDSEPEVWALLLPMTLLPTCIVALWQRRYASLWLITLGFIWTYGMVWQRHYMSTVRHFPIEGAWQLIGSLIPAYFVLALGFFGILTERAHWPRMLGFRTADRALDDFLG